MRAYARVVRLAVSAATLRSCVSGRLARRTSNSDRTRPFDAMVQPGKIRSPGIVARDATGTRPISAVPEASRSAHCEGSIQSTSYRVASEVLSGRCSKSHIKGAGLRKRMAAIRKRLLEVELTFFLDYQVNALYALVSRRDAGLPKHSPGHRLSPILPVSTISIEVPQ